MPTEPVPVAAERGLSAEARRLSDLAWPVIIAYLGTVAMGTVDAVMAGRLGAEALASVALGNAWNTAVAIVAMAASRALDPIVAQAHGAGDRRAAGLGLSRGLVMGLVLAVPTAALLLAARPALAAMGEPERLLPGAARFCTALIPGVPAILSFLVLRQFLQGLGLMRPGTAAVLLANLANAGLNWIFMYGNLGAPRLGIVGCALSTAVSQWLMLGLLAILARDTIRAYWPGWAGAFRPGPVLRLLSIGLPLGFQFGLEVWAFLAAAFVMGRLGASALAAHAVAINLATISFMIPSGIGAAAATRVGNLRGAGLPWARSAWTAVALGAAVMTVPGVLFASVPGTLARLYTADPGVLATAAVLLPLAAAFQVFDGAQAVAFGALRGLGDVRVPSAFNAVGYWLVGLPGGAWLAFRGGMGPSGVWTGLVVGLAVVAGLLLARLAALGRRERARGDGSG